MFLNCHMSHVVLSFSCCNFVALLSHFCRTFVALTTNSRIAKPIPCPIPLRCQLVLQHAYSREQSLTYPRWLTNQVFNSHPNAGQLQCFLWIAPQAQMNSMRWSHKWLIRRIWGRTRRNGQYGSHQQEQGSTWETKQVKGWSTPQPFYFLHSGSWIPSVTDHKQTESSRRP